MGIGPNPQSPIPNPHHHYTNIFLILQKIMNFQNIHLILLIIIQMNIFMVEILLQIYKKQHSKKIKNWQNHY
jgi:hypothetical protein